MSEPQTIYSVDIKESTVTITLSEYNELIEDQNFLRALEAAGVDNWEGYDFAEELMV